METSLSIEEALKSADTIDSDSPRLDVECLLCHVLTCQSTYLRTWPEKKLSEAQTKHFYDLLARRKHGEPIAHICGSRAFWTLELLVSPDTLIPRPDTEILVETILDLPLPERARVLDLGTGTGAIALALASERKDWQVIAADFHPGALRLVQQNVDKCKADNVQVLQSNWFEQIPPTGFDLIVSNPPYIDPTDQHLSEGDVRFEPLSALVAENGGLADLKHIIEHAKAYLDSGGYLVLEHGYKQAESVQSLLKHAGYSEINTLQDYGQQDRMTMAKIAINQG
ncbi:MAG: peptide chain release factor N(5)-glutamine methyltransferase [Oleiphilus sp.]